MAQTTGPDVLTLKKEQLPPSAKKIGSVKMLDGWRFNCGYTKTLEAVSEKARELGGNTIVITNVKSPDLWSTCYRIWADVYLVNNVEHHAQANITGFDSVAQTILPKTAPYALLYIYQPKTFGLIKNTLRVDENLPTVKKGNIKVVKFSKTGSIFRGRNGAVTKETIGIQLGKLYFLRCSMQSNGLTSTPVTERVSLEAALADVSLEELQQLAAAIKEKG